MDYGQYRDPAFLDLHEDSGVKVKVEDNTQQVVELELIQVEEPES